MLSCVLKRWVQNAAVTHELYIYQRNAPPKGRVRRGNCKCGEIYTGADQTT